MYMLGCKCWKFEFTLFPRKNEDMNDKFQGLFPNSCSHHVDALLVTDVLKSVRQVERPGLQLDEPLQRLSLQLD